MIWRRVMLVLLGVVAAAAPGAAAGRALSTDAFANVFVEGEAVRVKAVVGEAVPIVLRDLAGTEVARRDAPASAGETAVDFGPLAPGYYEAVAGETVLPLVVVIDPKRRVSSDSRLATDSAMSWLVKPEQFEGLARVLRLAGFGWVRERLSWGEVEKERGKLDWGKYEKSAAALAKEGIKIYQVFHSSPGWSRADRDSKAAPDDLRDIYRFARALARQFKGRVHAWEVWNEPDISFFSHPSSECAAFQKAAFLGFRAEDPSQLVLGPSMAHGVGPFSQNLLAGGAGYAMDIWNYHVYADPSAYPKRYEGYRELLNRHGLPIPCWVTEAGDPVRGPEGILTRESRIHQAAFVSRAYPQALAAGEERHFWFVFPFYREKETGWGLFEPNQRAPFPGLAAVATATYALGRGDYLGSIGLADKDARALAFARGDGTAAVAVWREADTPAEVALPIDWKDVSDARAHLGTPLPAGTGAFRPSVARSAVYAIVAEKALDGHLVRPPKPQAVKAAPKPGLPQVVTRLRVEGGRVDKDGDGYVVSPSATTAVLAEAYNFGEKPVAGDLLLSAPDGWELDQKRLSLSVPPGERVALPVRVTAPPRYDAGAIRLVARSGKQESSPAVVRLLVDASTAEAREARRLDLEKPGIWGKNIAGHGSMEVSAGAEGGVRFAFTFRTDGDNWAYPEARQDPPLDLSRFNALRFEYRTSVADSGPVRIMLVEADGPTYMTGAGLSGSMEWRSATVLFDSLTHLSLSKPDANGRLDTDRIANIRFGANSKPRELVLEVRNVQAVKL